MRWAGIVAIAIAGCGDDAPDPVVDAGADVTVLAIVPPDPPIAPTPPDFAECPDGYVIVRTARGTESCAAFEGESPRCGPYEAAFPGEPTCAPLAPCGSGPFPAAPEGVTPIYVLASSTADGRGTRAAPFKTLDEALMITTPGRTILLGAGEYQGGASMSLDTTIIGLCPERTRIVADGFAGGLRIAGSARLELEGVSIETTGAGLVAERGELVVRNVIVERAVGGGMLVTDGSLDAERVVVRNVALAEDDLASGIGLFRSRATIDRALLEDLAGSAFHAHNSSLTLRRAIARRTERSALGVGVTIIANSMGSFDRVWVEDAGNYAVLTGRGSVVQGQYLDVRGAVFGVGASAGGLRLDHATIEDVELAAGQFSDGATVTLRDVVIEGVTSSADGVGGIGVIADTEAALTLQRVSIERTREAGLAAEDTVLRAEDLRILDAASRVDGIRGEGINLYNGVDAELARVHIEAAHFLGLSVHDPDHGPSNVRVSDLTVVDVAGQESDGDNGIGVHVSRGAHLEIDRLLVDRATLIGVHALSEGTELTLRDARIVATRARPSDGRFGRGIEASEQAHVTAERLAIEHVRDFGLLVIDNAVLSATDVTIDDTQERECASSGCVDFPFGVGIGTYVSATTHLERFAVQRAALCGAHVSTNAQLELAHGLVADNPIAICLESEGYDVTQLTDDVRYERNGATLQATTLPVPEPRANVIDP